MTKSGAERMLDAERYGFWTRTKLPPHRAVVWEPQFYEDGRESFRGRNWVEVLPYRSDREPERFFTADVETVGPHEWLDYYPQVASPICGWCEAPNSGKYCPRKRRGNDAFCPRHMAELSRGEEPHGEDESGSDGEPVPAPE